MPRDKQQARQQQKRGHHVSISGDPADETLSDLIGQFSDPYAFVRELIQNSLDAGAQRIEIGMSYEEGTLKVEVIDDGEGMDRATIEGYLLTLFRSTKEEDLTKIGKFGIGFVSLFAIGPREVHVDTGRDAIWHRVVFDKTRSYKIFEMDEPFEGTTVRLLLQRTAAEARTDCEMIRQSATRWCGYADADITSEATGIVTGWKRRSIARPFTVPCPVVVTVEEDGLSAVLGPSREPISGFYNQGLTLWEEQSPLIPGVSFRVKATHLEHTLTRDNVIRDRHFDRVMSRLTTIAAGALGDAVHEALAVADLPQVKDIFAALSHERPWAWRESAPLVPTVDGKRASMADLKRSAPGWLRSLWSSAQRRDLFWAPLADEVGVAVAAQGHLVLAGDDPTDAHLAFLASLVGASLVAVHERFFAPLRPVDGAACAAHFLAANALANRAGLSYTLHPARALVMGTSEPRFAVTQREPFALEPIQPDGVAEGEHLLVDITHPLYQPIHALPPDLAAPLLVRAAVVGASVQEGPVDPAHVLVLQ